MVGGAQRHHDQPQAPAFLRAEGAGAVNELGTVLHIGDDHRQAGVMNTTNHAFARQPATTLGLLAAQAHGAVDLELAVFSVFQHDHGAWQGQLGRQRAEHRTEGAVNIQRIAQNAADLVNSAQLQMGAFLRNTADHDAPPGIQDAH